MDTTEKIGSFKERVTKRVFNEYTRNGTVATRVYILGFHETDGYVVGSKNIPGILHLDGDEFDEGYIGSQVQVERFIRRFEDKGNRAICVCQVESGYNEVEGRDNIFLSFRTGKALKEEDIVHYGVDSDPLSVNAEGVLVDALKRFNRIQ